MPAHRIKRWLGLAVAAALILGTIFTWWVPANSASSIVISPGLIAKLGSVEPEEASPLLTDIYDELADAEGVQQVLLLQAVPNEAPIVVATVEDSSDEEDATHWPSPWQAVNVALKAGSISDRMVATGRHAGFDYVHTLIPVDETHSRILLINHAASAPTWGLQRGLLLLAGVTLLLYLMVSRE
ncbi:MAG: hypothetical protein KF777_17620 [Planctomycetaceae bacterium]|nr:hypothetical protein [Planctomycetaceae bacterium]